MRGEAKKSARERSLHRLARLHRLVPCIELDIAPATGGIEQLVAEILHYLEVVELFRREQYEPSWRTEGLYAEVLG